LACAIIVFLKRPDHELVRRMSLRLVNIAVSAGVLCLVSVPILINNRQAIYAYYFVNHVVNDQKNVRAKEAGINDLLGHFLYYPDSIHKPTPRGDVSLKAST
jgi:hypothetical protein